MVKFTNLGRSVLLLLFIAAAGLTSSCTEKISGVGSGYLRDTISSGTQVFSDSSTLHFSQITKRTLTVSGLTYSENVKSTVLLFGKVAGDIEAWTAMKMPFLPDSIGQVVGDTLILRMRYAYHYGDASDENVDFSVWTETGNAVNDSTTTLSQSNLGKVVGTYKATIKKDTTATISVPLDTAILNSLLRTASLVLVIVPNASMNTVRNFASIENGDNTFSPALKLSIQGTAGVSTILRNPVTDCHYVISDNATLPGEFTLRGSYAKHSRLVIDIRGIRTQLALNPFVTINSALLQLRSDPAAHKYSDYPVDTAGPVLAYVTNTGVADTGHFFVEYGSHSSADVDLYAYQVRAYIEHALRNGDDSLVFEFRSGFSSRIFNGATIDAEDYNINRWGLYGFDVADKTKRPQLLLTYSFLR
ncbi:MAG: hypothetical protein WCH46_09505 [bacterium]